jgi:hypothetical protein
LREVILDLPHQRAIADHRPGKVSRLHGTIFPVTRIRSIIVEKYAKERPNCDF